MQIEASILGRLQQLEYILGSHRIDSFLAVLGFALKVSAHGVGFTTARLTIGETRGHATFENGFDQRLG